MSLTVNSRIIADETITGLAIRPVVGAFELIFFVTLKMNAIRDTRLQAIIAGAKVSVKGANGREHDLGYVRPAQSWTIEQRDFDATEREDFFLTLLPGQLAALEELRGAGDLQFELNVTGTGFEDRRQYQVYDTWRYQEARSDWIKKLRDAKFRDVLLLEVPIPLSTLSPEWEEISNHLKRAEEHYRLSNFLDCVGACRTVIQELGYLQFKEKEWAGPFLKQLSNEPRKMTKSERSAAMWASLRHYTHQAHHGASESGHGVYGRHDAQLALTLTAAFVAQVQSETSGNHR